MPDKSDEVARLKVSERQVIGKAVKNLRNEGQIPAVIQEAGKSSTVVSVPTLELDKVYAQVGQRHPVELELSGSKQLAVIKEVEFKPVKRRLLHVVFQAIKANQRITAEIQVEFSEGEIPAEKNGLIILRTLDQVEVETLPANMPDTLTVDPTGLSEVGDKLTVADIKVPANVIILTEPEEALAVVEEPRVAEEEPAETEEASEEVPAEHGDEAADNVGEAKTDSDK